MFEDLTLEDPDLDAAGAVGRVSRGDPIIDVGAQRVKRHPTLAVPFLARDLGAAETAGAVDPDTLRTEAHRRLHGALHGPAEGHAALELLRDRVGHQRRVDLRLADLEDVDHDLRGGELADHLAQLVDVRALLADHHTRTSRMNGDAGLPVRALDHDLRDRRLLQRSHQHLADLHVLVKQLAVFVLVGEPTGVPGAVDAEPQPDRIDLLTHDTVPQAVASTSRTMIVRLEKGFSMRPARPRARGLNRFITMALPT